MQSSASASITQDDPNASAHSAAAEESAADTDVIIARQYRTVYMPATSSDSSDQCQMRHHRPASNDSSDDDGPPGFTRKEYREETAEPYRREDHAWSNSSSQWDHGDAAPSYAGDSGNWGSQPCVSQNHSTERGQDTQPEPQQELAAAAAESSTHRAHAEPTRAYSRWPEQQDQAPYHDGDSSTPYDRDWHEGWGGWNRYHSADAAPVVARAPVEGAQVFWKLIIFLETNSNFGTKMKI